MVVDPMEETEVKVLQERDFARMAINKLFIKSLHLITQASRLAKRSPDPNMRQYYRDKLRDHQSVVFREAYNYDYAKSYMHLIHQELSDREPKKCLIGK